MKKWQMWGMQAHSHFESGCWLVSEEDDLDVYSSSMMLDYPSHPLAGFTEVV